MILLFHTIFHPVINYLVHFFAFHLQAKKNHVSFSTSNCRRATVYRLDSKTLSLVHSIPSWLVWVDIESTVHVASPNDAKTGLNQFRKAENRRYELTVVIYIPFSARKGGKTKLLVMCGNLCILTRSLIINHIKKKNIFMESSRDKLYPLRQRDFNNYILTKEKETNCGVTEIASSVTDQRWSSKFKNCCFLSLAADKTKSLLWLQSNCKKFNSHI